MKKVILTGPIIGDALTRLPDGINLVHVDDGIAVIDGIGVMTQDRFERELPDAWGILSIDRLKLDATRIDMAPNLKVIANHGAGYDNIDLEHAKRRGIIVTNTPHPVTAPTADLGWTLLLATARHAVEGDRIMREQRYEGWKNDFLLGPDLTGKTLGIFGCGRIGQAVAKRARGWDMKVIYHKRHRLDDAVERDLNASLVDFDTLLAESDFLFVTAPHTAETHHAFTLDAFEKMKRSAIFINIARGKLVKETDLAEALQRGLIWGAGLDVYETSPKMAPGLAESPRTTFLPHIGSATYEARKAMGDSVVQAILDVHAGRTPAHVL